MNIFLNHQLLLNTAIFKYMNTTVSYRCNLFNKFPIVGI